MKSKIIFLDYENIVYADRVRRALNRFSKLYYPDPVALEFLKRICGEKWIKIVITSERLLKIKTKDRFLESLGSNHFPNYYGKGLENYLHENERVSKGDKIKAIEKWIKKNNYQGGFLILDSELETIHFSENKIIVLGSRSNGRIILCDSINGMSCETYRDVEDWAQEKKG